MIDLIFKKKCETVFKKIAKKNRKTLEEKWPLSASDIDQSFIFSSNF